MEGKSYKGEKTVDDWKAPLKKQGNCLLYTLTRYTSGKVCSIVSSLSPVNTIAKPAKKHLIVFFHNFENAFG